MTESKFNECVRTQSKRLYLIALSFTKNQADAEDILQNVYLKLWNCKKEFESDEHMAKWLTKVCVNESKDLLRLHFRKRNVPLEDAVNLSHIDDTQDIDLIKAVMSLPKNQRTVIHLFYFEDLQINEIATLLNIKESAVKTRLSRARQKLKAKLGDDDHEE